MTETFTIKQFEEALPTDKTGAPLWRYVGFVQGEHVYAVDVKEGVVIRVRSSIGVSGVAAGAGEDSIRVMLAADDKGTPLGSKDQRWVTRTKNWRANMKNLIRKFWILGAQLPVCPTCGKRAGAYKSKTGEHAGDWYAKCYPCDWWAKWLFAETTERKEVA